VARPPALIGYPRPRLATPPTGRRGRGAEAVEFAREVLGIELMPWQVYLLDRACRTGPGHRWSHRTVLTIVARQNGKSLVTAVRILAGMWLWGERLAIAAAQSRDVAIEAWKYTVDLAVDADLPVTNVLRTTGREELQITHPEGRLCRYKVVSSTAGGGRGIPGVDLVVLDELREYKDWAPYAALDKTRRARPSSQLWTISTEGDETSVVLDALQAQGRAAAAARTPGPLAYFEWSAPPELERADRRGWQASNPALGHTLDEATLAAELATDPANVFEVEVLCRRVTAMKSWLPAERWAEVVDPGATVPDDAAGAVSFAIDSGPELRHVTIAAAWPRPDGRTHVEALDAFTGAGASSAAEARLRELVTRWRPRRVTVVKRGAVEAPATRACSAVEGLLDALTTADVERACRSFYEATISRRLVAPPGDLLEAHLAAAQPGEPGTIGLRRRSTSTDIDAAVAAVLALWAADTAPARSAWVAY